MEGESNNNNNNNIGEGENDSAAEAGINIFPSRPLGPVMSILFGDDETVLKCLNSDDEIINNGLGTHDSSSSSRRHSPPDMPDDFLNAIMTIINLSPPLLPIANNILRSYINTTLSVGMTNGIEDPNMSRALNEELHYISQTLGSLISGLSPMEVEQRMERYRFISADQEIYPEEVSRCSICLEKFATNDELGRLHCGHENHYECIKLWLVRKNSCPVCIKIALPPPT